MSRRLYLFDIDGTLVATGGAGSGAMRAAFTAVWGLADGFSGIEVSGRTARAIPRDAPPRRGRAPPLAPLAADRRATVALGTGNFRVSAGQKLRHYGLDHYFRVGGFGDSTEDRVALIAQAIRTADRAAGHHATVFVIGDTGHAVVAAKAHGAVAVAVATGTA